MRRMFLLVGMTVLLVIVAAGVALAVVKTCNNIPCRGTDNDDVLHERIRRNQGANVHPDGLRDRILALNGKDDIEAVVGKDDRDVLLGGRKGDDLFANDGDFRDAVRGGAGRDRCFIDDNGNQRDSTRSCEVIRTDATANSLPQEFGNTSNNLDSAD